MMYMRLRDSTLALAAAALVAACGGATSRSASGSPSPVADSYDVMIVNGRVVDGSGNAWFYGDVRPAFEMAGADSVKLELISGPNFSGAWNFPSTKRE